MLRSAPLFVVAAVVAFGCGKTEVRGGEAGPAKPVASEDKSEPAQTREAAHATPGAMPPMHGQANPHAPAEPKGEPQDITPSGETTDEALAELAVSVPTQWKKSPPRSSMRLAQYALPGPGGDAELVVFRFKGGAGGVEQNVARWKDQFTPPEGKSIDDVTKVDELTVGELKVTLVDVSGRFVAAVRPGAEQKHDEPDSRMLAAIVQGSGDPYFFKAVGPKKTLDVWADAYRKMVESMKPTG